MGLFSKLFSSVIFYSRIGVSYITKGFSDVPSSDDVLADDELFYSINRIFTKNKVKKMYFVSELPRLVDEGFLYDLKFEVEAKCNTVNRTHSLNEKCELIDIVIAEPYAMDFGTFKNRSRMMMWKRRYENALAEGADRTELDEMVSSKEVIDKSDRNRWMIESWMFVRRAKDVEKSSFCKTNIVLELVADSDMMLKECEVVIRDFMFRNDIKYNEIFLQTNEYYKAFSPVGNDRNNLLAKMNPPTILNDDIVTSFDVPTHGVVGDDEGLYFGTDIHTGLPIFYDITKGSDAQNFLVTADTGGGKSNYMKGVYSYVDLLGLNSITLDYEGDEYTPMGDLYGEDTAFIKVSGERSRYFNTIAIGDLTGDPNIDNDLKREAVSVTERVFSLLLDEKNGMTAHERSLYNDCVTRVFEKFKVTDDPETWINSKQITYFHLYGELEMMSKEDAYIDGYGDHVKDMVIKLRTYFEKGAINRSMFDNPINLDELLGSRHVIFSFGMKGVDQSLIDTKELALKQLFVGYITTLISNYNKSRGNLTVIYLEELQRYLAHEHSGSVVANITSGGRKRNMIVFLITNTPTQLMDALETDSDLRKHAAAIMGRVNGFVIGKLKNSESLALIKYFSLEDCEADLLTINRGGSMKYSFLVNYKGESSVVKYLFHPDLLETPLYKTRTDKVEEEDED